MVVTQLFRTLQHLTKSSEHILEPDIGIDFADLDGAGIGRGLMNIPLAARQAVKVLGSSLESFLFLQTTHQFRSRILLFLIRLGRAR